MVLVGRHGADEQIDIFFSYGRFGVVRFLKIGNQETKEEEKIMRFSVIAYSVYGILMLSLATGSLLTTDELFVSLIVATIAFIAAIVAFVYVGFEIGKQKKDNPYCESVKFKKLKPGIYGVKTNPFPVKDLFPFRSHASYFMLIELCARPIIVEFPDNRSRGSLQMAMGKLIKDITNEEGFTIDKKGRVTNNRA